MADETNTVQTETQQAETDWKAKYEQMRTHSRDWEKKAKANQSAAEELEKLRTEQMSEQEKANKRAEAAEAELQALKAEKAKVDAAQKLSAESGVPLDLLMFCADEDAMTEFAKKYAEETHVSSAPSALGGSRVIRGNNEAPKDNSELFAEFASGFFNK